MAALLAADPTPITLLLPAVPARMALLPMPGLARMADLGYSVVPAPMPVPAGSAAREDFAVVVG